VPLRATSRHAGGEGRASMIPDGGRGPRARENGRGRGNLTFRNRVIFVTQMRGLIEDLRQCESRWITARHPQCLVCASGISSPEETITM